MEKKEGRLNRDWINFDLADKMQNLIAGHVNTNPAGNPYGTAFATLCLCIVSALANAHGLDDNQRIVIMGDVFEFMTDLFNNGWTAPPSKEKVN